MHHPQQHTDVRALNYGLGQLCRASQIHFLHCLIILLDFLEWGRFGTAHSTKSSRHWEYPGNVAIAWLDHLMPLHFCYIIFSHNYKMMWKNMSQIWAFMPLTDCSLLETKSHGSLCLVVPSFPHSCSCMSTGEKRIIYQSMLQGWETFLD